MNKQTIDHLAKKVQKTEETLTNSERNEISAILKAHKESLRHNDLVHELSQIGRKEIPRNEWKAFFRNCIQKIGEGIQADCIRYYNFTFKAETGEPGLIPEVVWQAQSSRDLFDPGNSPTFLSQRKYSSLFERMRNRSSFQTTPDKEDIGPLKMLMQADKCLSMLVLPVRSNTTLYGMLRVDSCHKDRKWSDSELNLLHPIIFQLRNILEKRDLEKQLHSTYRQAQIGTWEMDIKSGNFSWSKVTKEIFELDSKSLPNGELAADLFYDERSKNKVMEAVERAQITGEPYDLEIKIKTAKGNAKWVRDTGQAQFKNGKCVRLYGIVQDIHKRKLAEQESEKNKRLLEAITQQTEVAVWVRNDSGDILFVNKQWKSIFGLEEKEVIGASLRDFFEKKHADEMIASDRSVVKNNKQVIFEELIKTASGPRHFMVNKFLLKGISGFENAVGGIGTDITEIKKTEERLQKAEEKLREIIEHSTNLFYTHDVNHKLTYLSPQSIDFLGYHPDEAKRRWIEFVSDHPDNEKGFHRTQRAIETGEPQPPFELELVRGDGVKIWVEVNEAPVIKDGKIVSIAGSLTDVTKRKEAQSKIRDSLREKETLLAEIHHRVKNNLAVVASLMQLQAMESESQDVRGELLESVLRIKSMAGIHEHLYKTEDFSNLDFAHNLKTLVGEIVDTMQYSVDISLKFECDEVRLSVNQAIPCSLVVNEVITNIIKHGFKGRKTGSVVIRLYQNDKTVTLAIKDNGVGLPADFNPESTKTLGMQLIKTLSDQLFGTFKFESDEEGSIFTLSFQKKADKSLHT
ncbi:PAS domain S-box protein [Rhodohalobacter sp. 8-1]|uniref:PAS domain S-box protein n=1 Tax=Rhodohalobacter sp. 8-1 TaxID=3131972 RepID=UPI0030EC4779